MHEQLSTLRQHLSVSGASINTLTDKVLAMDVISDEFRNSKMDTNLLKKLINSVKPITSTHGKETQLLIFTELQRDNFLKLACQSYYSTPDYTETPILCNVLYSTDSLFTNRDIPVYHESVKDSKYKDYKPSEVYCIRVMHSEISQGIPSLSDDIVLYVPTRFFV